MLFDSPGRADEFDYPDEEEIPDLSGSGGKLDKKAAVNLIPEQRALEFLERSTIAYGTPVGLGGAEKLVFEAEIATHLHFFSNLRRQAEHGEPFAWGALFSFLPHLRMYNTSSNPVKMPSYKPRVGLQLFWFPKNSNTKSVKLLGAMLAVGHYSNGQSGYTYVTGVPDTDPICCRTNSLVENLDLAKELNRRSGGFSTNYVSLQVGLRWMILDDNRIPRQSVSLVLRPMFRLKKALSGFLNGETIE